MNVTTHFNKYDVIMKVLEIIQQDGAIGAGSVQQESITQITNIIHRLDGNIIQQQVEVEEVTVEGDKFENINQSVIATRGSFAHGVITLKEKHGDEVANAFKTIESALNGEAGASLAAERRKEALDLLNEMAQQGSKPDSSKSVLKSLGKGLWTLITSVEPLSKACTVAWPIIEKLWS
jgi:hypothetical protein